MTHHRASRPERLCALDIETVPDRDLLPADWGEKFPRTIHHRVVCISFVEAEIEIDGDGRERFRMTDCRSGGEPDWSEAQLLEGFWSYFAKRPTRIVSWNGRGFDVPVLLHRSMIHGLTAAGWYGSSSRCDGYGYRYADDRHCDLMDQMSDYGACAKLSLDDVARALGLPGKIGGHGSEVEAMVAEGRIDDVRRYCEGDVLNLFGVYLRHALLTGRSTKAGHDAGVEAMRTWCSARTEPHIAAFAGIGRSPTTVGSPVGETETNREHGLASERPPGIVPPPDLGPIHIDEHA